MIFKTKEAADLCVSKINMGCLMLPNGRYSFFYCSMRLLDDIMFVKSLIVEIF